MSDWVLERYWSGMYGASHPGHTIIVTGDSEAEVRERIAKVDAALVESHAARMEWHERQTGRKIKPKPKPKPKPQPQGQLSMEL